MIGPIPVVGGDEERSLHAGESFDEDLETASGVIGLDGRGDCRHPDARPDRTAVAGVCRM